jgi:hypothetical protein
MALPSWTPSQTGGAGAGTLNTELLSVREGVACTLTGPGVAASYAWEIVAESLPTGESASITNATSQIATWTPATLGTARRVRIGLETPDGQRVLVLEVTKTAAGDDIQYGLVPPANKERRNQASDASAAEAGAEIVVRRFRDRLASKIGDIYAAIASGGASLVAATIIRPHDNAYSPVAHWKLDGNSLDTVGSTHLTLLTGIEAYAVQDGITGFAFNGQTALQSAAATLLLTGDMTFQLLCSSWLKSSSVLQWLIAETGNGTLDTEVNNTLWGCYLEAATVGRLTHFSEHVGGTNNTVTTTSYSVASSTVNHVAATRISNVWRTYVDGILVHTGGALVTPVTGGAPVQRVCLGGIPGSGQYLTGWESSVIVHNTALSDAQILRNATYCLRGGA